MDIRQWMCTYWLTTSSAECMTVEFGFALSFEYKSFNYNTTVENHPSASQFPQAVNEYLQTKLEDRSQKKSIKKMLRF